MKLQPFRLLNRILTLTLILLAGGGRQTAKSQPISSDIATPDSVAYSFRGRSPKIIENVGQFDEDANNVEYVDYIRGAFYEL